MDILTALFTDYLNEVNELISRRRPGEGILGTRGGPSDSPCHEHFYNKVGEYVAKLAAEGPDADTACAVVSFLLRDEALDNISECAKWTLIAVQQHCLPLLPFLTVPQAVSLLKEYERIYPRRDRLPAQTDVIRALKKRAG